MYSVVLMMAMTGGAEAPAGLFGHGGCHGSYYASCSGSCTGYYATCTGWSCHGSSGHGWAHHSHSCHGGYGYESYSCYGSSCYGSCHGHSHHTSWGCCGGYAHESYSCCGGGWFGHHHRSHEYCCEPVYYGCTGSGCYGTPVAPAVIPVAPEEKKMEKKTEATFEAPATLVVSVPADAKLLIDDAVTASTSTRRVFISPALPVGREFTYTLKATYTKDGKPVVVSKDVTVRAGAEIAVTMEAGLVGVASR